MSRKAPRFGVSLLVGLSLAACASGSGSGSSATAPRAETNTVFFRADLIPVTRFVTAPAKTIWAALPRTFADLGLPAGPSADEVGRVFLTPSLRIHGRLYKGELNSVYLDCGHSVEAGRAADSYEVTFAMMVRLTPQDSGYSRVEVFIGGTATHRTVNLTNPVSCTGTGRLEAEFLRRLEGHLKSP